MYAIIQDGGHQHKVEAGATCLVERKDAVEGDKITFDKVLAIGGDELRVGAPFVEGATVEATVVRHAPGKKILVQVFRRRKDSRRRRGHRQKYTELRIDAING